MRPVSGMAIDMPSALPTVSGVQNPHKDRPDEENGQDSHVRPLRDEYVPEEKQEPTGRYWLDRDEEGQPKVRYDDPEKSDDREAVRCRGNTDQVDHEIRELKQRADELKRQIAAETDEARRGQLEKELSQVESELSQKGNDTYRRQHTKFS